MNETHLARLKVSANPADWPGAEPLSWARWVSEEAADKYRPWLKSKRITRDELACLCRQAEAPSEVLFLSIMAWGGMNRLHGKRAWDARQKGLIDGIDWLRSADHSAHESFSRFRDLKLSGKTPGLGPAYFTKLIFFFSHSDNAFIMDQWTAKSVNLLFGPFIHLALGQDRGKDTVTDRNDAKVYANFCEQVLALKPLLGCDTGAEVERTLFSQARPTPDHWRFYVKTVWNPKTDNAGC